MPTEVFPATHHQPHGYALPLPMVMGGWSSMPASGPARSIDCVRPNTGNIGGRVLPGGLRNPWGAYNGETYMPASEAAENIQISSRSAYGGAASQLGVAMGGLGIGGSVVGSAMSGHTGRSIPSVGLGGYRNDDGWDGSVGRVHRGFNPDMTSTAGAIPRINQHAPSNWLQAPADPRNHVRMTPSLPGMPRSLPPHSVIIPQSDMGYLNRPIMESRPRRIPSVKVKVPKPVQEECASCASCVHCDREAMDRVRGGSRIEGGKSRVREAPKEIGGSMSVYKKIPRSPHVNASQLSSRDHLGPHNRSHHGNSVGRHSSSGSSRSRSCVQCSA